MVNKMMNTMNMMMIMMIMIMTMMMIMMIMRPSWDMGNAFDQDFR